MSRHADDERVPAAEEAGEHVINHVLLADDDLGGLAENLLARLAELLDGLERVGGGSRYLAFDGSVKTWVLTQRFNIFWRTTHFNQRHCQGHRRMTAMRAVRACAELLLHRLSLQYQKMISGGGVS